MKRNYKKIGIALCMAACMGGACIGCTTSGNTSEDTENVQNIEGESTSEDVIIEKEVEIESDSGEKIEFSIEGAAGDADTQSYNDK